jgi:hypothetical protein
MSCGCGDSFSCDDVSAGGLVVGVPGPRGPRGEKGDNGEGFGDLSVFGRSLVVAADAQAGREALDAARWVYHNVKDYGAVGDGVADDTAAIEAAHADILAGAGKGALFFPTGNFVYEGSGLGFSPDRPVRIVGLGAGQGSHPGSYGSSITLGSGSYLLNLTNYLHFLLMRDLRVVGGLGALRHTYKTVNVSQQKLIVQNCHFENYTECAIATDSFDMPYWIIENCVFRSANTTGTIGVALGRNSNQSVIQNCSFTRNRVHLKVRNGNDLQVQNCDFLQSVTNNSAGPRVTGLWVVPAPTDAAAAENLFVRGCKFGNENEVAGDFKVVIADESAAGTTNGNKLPEFGANSSGFVTGVNISHNSISSNSLNAAAPFIYSTTPNVRGLQVCSNVINGTKPKYVLEFRDPSIVQPSHLAKSVFGPFTATTMGSHDVALVESNVAGVAEWIDPLMVHQTPGTIRHNGGGSSSSYRQLLAGSITTAGQAGGATKVPIADAFGGADAITLTHGTSTVSSAFLALPAFTVGLPVWVEMDVANPGGVNAAEWSRVIVRDNNAAFHFSRTFRTPAVGQGWVTYAWSFTPRTVGNKPTYFQIGAPDAFSAGETVSIGRVRVYHANERQLGGRRPGVLAAATDEASTQALVNDLREKLISLGVVWPAAAQANSGGDISGDEDEPVFVEPDWDLI